jgi:hypothetical protein
MDMIPDHGYIFIDNAVLSILIAAELRRCSFFDCQAVKFAPVRPGKRVGASPHSSVKDLGMDFVMMMRHFGK